ncbi:MAG: hypothetical protein ACRYHQ_23230 [Janthinobacterium lividum]
MGARAVDGRFWAAHRKRQATQPNGRTSSIRTVIAAAAKAGRAVPTDAELAALFAISIERVKHHRRLRGM